MPLTKSKLTDSITGCRLAVARWRSIGAEVLSESDAESGLTTLIRLTDTMDVERDPDTRQLVLAIDDVCRQAIVWRDHVETQAEHDVSGSPELWKAWQVVEDLVRHKANRKPPEPIGALVTQGVGHEQIAKMYGWFTEGGEPDQHKVAQEIAKPGSQLNPRTWRDPYELDDIETAVAPLWAEREARFNADKAQLQKEANQRKAENEQPRETIESLLPLEGISYEQIAKMTGKSVEVVRKAAAEAGVTLRTAERAAERIRKASDANDREAKKDAQKEYQDALSDIETYPGVELDNRILQMFADGHRPKVIADALKREVPDLSFQQVTSIVKISQANDPKAKPEEQPA